MNEEKIPLELIPVHPESDRLAHIRLEDLELGIADEIGRTAEALELLVDSIEEATMGPAAHFYAEDVIVLGARATCRNEIAFLRRLEGLIDHLEIKLREKPPKGE